MGKLVKPAYVYAICEDESGPVKIGIAEHCWERVRYLQLGNPRELKLGAQRGPWKRNFAWNVERTAHALLTEFALPDLFKEWFMCPVSVVEAAIDEAIKIVPALLEDPLSLRPGKKFADRPAYAEYLRQMGRGAAIRVYNVNKNDSEAIL